LEKRLGQGGDGLRANFVKMDPSGNTTAFILDPFPRELHPQIAAEVMKASSLAVEQVGFVEAPTIPGAVARLQMMAGEFCGNASRAFAAYLAERQYPGVHRGQNEAHLTVPIEVSGYEGLILAEVNHCTATRKASVKVNMPCPLFIRQLQLSCLEYPLDLVGFEGIIHAVLWNVTPSEKLFHDIKAELSRELQEYGCLGVMFYDEEAGFLTPVVYVEQVGSLVWESSCGSGTVAVAAALANRQQQNVGLELTQPGGVVGVEVVWKGKVTVASIFGEVSHRAEGVVYFDLLESLSK
jgi:diaminopimelate epimerase